jgi:hypothetical protein
MFFQWLYLISVSKTNLVNKKNAKNKLNTKKLGFEIELIIELHMRK